MTPKSTRSIFVFRKTKRYTDISRNAWYFSPRLFPRSLGFFYFKFTNKKSRRI